MRSLPAKTCARCRKHFYRRKAESNYAYARRLYCSARCEPISKQRLPLGGLWEAFAKGVK